MAQNKEFKLCFVTQNNMINEISTDKELYNLLKLQRDNYLIALSDKFIDMPIENIIKDEKKYFLASDKSSKLYYLICYYNNIPVGVCKFIDFSDKIFHIDFFQKLRPKKTISNGARFLYVFGVYVNDKYRGMGICKKMLEKVINCSEKMSVKLIISDIKKDNSSSIKCFNSSGFTKTNIISRFPDVYFYAHEI